MLLSTFFVLLLMIIVVDVIVYETYRRDIQGKELNSIRGSIDILSDNMDSIVETLETQIVYRLWGSGVFNYLGTSKELNQGSVETSIKEMAELLRMSEGLTVKDIFIEDIQKKQYYYSEPGTSFRTEEEYKGSDIYKYIEAQGTDMFPRRGTTMWRYFSDDPDTIYLIKSSVSQDTVEFQGIICIGIDKSYLANMTKSTLSSNLIFDDEGKLLYADDDKIDIAGYFYSQDANRSGQHATDGYFYSKTVMPRKGWTIIGLVNKNEALSAMGKLINSLMLIESAVLAAMAVVIYLISHNLTKNISALSDDFSRINEGNEPVLINPISNDETAFLARQFNSMYGQLKESVKQMGRDSTLREKAEYNALLAQMNPHFLYNSLEAISSMAKLHGEKDIVEATGILSSLLRASLMGEQQEICLSRELDYVEKYLNFQALLTGHRIGWDISADDSIKTAMVPKLFLQPIIENAITHGLNAVLSGAMIVIVCRKRDELLEIEICDNGVGISQESADRLLNVEEPEELKRDRAHIGIQSINKRIHILYGSEYGLTIKSSEGQGMIVRITIPYHVGLRGDNNA